MGYAVATGHVLTTEAAEGVLAAGGTAVDACIAAACTSFVTEPMLAQPLGGGFVLVAPENGAPVCLDAFVQTPAAKRPEAELDLKTITVDFGTETQDFHMGAGTVAAPCMMAGLFEAHDRLGRVPMRELVAHAVKTAREGCEILPFQAHVMELLAPILTDNGGLSLYTEGGKPLAAGARFANPELADVLEVMAAEGPRFFSEGEIGQALAALPGAQVTAGDLRRAAPRWRAPLAITRQGHDIALNPPPSLGGVQIALALSVLCPGPNPALTARALETVARLRRETDIDAEPELAEARLLAPERLSAVAAVLEAHRPATRGTTHISVIDASGTGAALTLTNGESCGRMLPGTGILPNNMLGEEDLVPEGPTAWRPDARLASMMCPMAVRGPDGALTMLGSGGSNRIRSALTTVPLALIDTGCGLEEAITAPRMHFQGGALSFEDLGDEARRAALLAHWPEATVWERQSMYFGGVHAARRDAGGGFSAAGDPRRSGAAATG